MTNAWRTRLLHLLMAVAVFGLDRWSKLWVIAHIQEDVGEIPVLSRCFSITHVENPGAAFGFLAASSAAWRPWLLIAFSSAALLVVGVLLYKTAARWSSGSVALALVLGGAAGNLWDRLLRHKVTDFLHAYWGPHVWPDFNVADSAICVGAALLVIELIWPRAAATSDAAE